jgi:hypothetical protein
MYKKILIVLCLLVTFLIIYYYANKNSTIYTEIIKEAEQHFIDINGNNVKDVLILETTDGSDSQGVVTYYATPCVWQTYRTANDSIIYAVQEEVERHVIDVNGDGVRDTLILEHDPLVSPQTFEHIKIKVADGNLYVVRCIDGYNIDTTTKINRNNLVNSDNIFVLEQTPDGIIMLVWDYFFPSCHGKFTIIQFHRGTFIFNEIEDRIISSVFLSGSGDTITVQGHTSCEEDGETETFHFSVVGVGTENVRQHQNDQSD